MAIPQAPIRGFNQVSSAAQTVEAKCYCGRPLGHTGRHIGGLNKKTLGSPKGIRSPKFMGMIEAEIAGLHQMIGKLKSEIRAKQHALLDAEFKLKPLAALLEAYQNKRIEGPVVASSSQVQQTHLAVVAERPPPKPVTDATEDDFEPVEVTFEAVKRWAAQRNLTFKTWDDLRAINQRREQFELPPFKKKL